MTLDRGSSKHGAWTDDMMAGEVRGLIRSGHDTRAEEWRSPEPPLDDEEPLPPLTAEQLAATGTGAQPGADAAGEGERMTAADVVERAELARWLGRSAFPGRPRSIARGLRHRNAPERFIAAVESLPPTMTVENIGELWRAINNGGHVENRRF
jgi:hypothetical protein